MMSVSFEIFCDDYCTKIYNSNKVIFSKGKDKYEKGCYINPIFDLMIEIKETVGFTTLNSKAEFGFAGAVDYHYFKIHTGNRNIKWIVTDSNCDSKKRDYGYNELSSKRRLITEKEKWTKQNARLHILYLFVGII